MNISIAGAGYVGLVAGACLANQGHRVILVDVDREKIAAIRRGESPIYEPQLEELLQSAPLEATHDLVYATRNSDISFICLGTYNSPIGSADLQGVKEVTEAIGQALHPYHLVVIKSTVPPGTTEKVLLPLLEKHGRKVGRDFSLCVNPEFLREGSAVWDFLYPDRIIIGEGDPRGGDILVQLYEGFNCPILRFDLKTAEMIKYAANAFLATKVSFINELGNICKQMGIDVYQIAQGIALDSRIGNKFLNAGIGFGGSCLPKDLKTLIARSRETGYHPHILEAVSQINEEQPLRMMELLKKHLPSLKGKRIGVLGLSFKPDTDDVRDSRAIRLIETLLEEGALVRAYDPKAMDSFRKLFPHLEYTDAQGVLDCEAVLIVTEWEEFHHLDYQGKTVIDGRRIPQAREARIYEGICW